MSFQLRQDPAVKRRSAGAGAAAEGDPSLYTV